MMCFCVDQARLKRERGQFDADPTALQRMLRYGDGQGLFFQRSSLSNRRDSG